MLNERDAAENRWTGAVAIAIYFSFVKFAFHLLTNGRYGYFRDELYYLACSNHLDWGYVDLAPLSIPILKAIRMILGDSLHAVRFLPALAGSAATFLTGMIARELGGKRFAVALACLCFVIAPVYLVTDLFFSMNAFEPLLWMGSAYVLILVIKREEPKLLLWFGLLAGLGLENKHSMAFWGGAMIVGLLLTADRDLFASKWMWIAGGIALFIFLPNVVWQIQHHWPTIEDLSNVRKTHKNVELPPPAFLGQQILMLLPTTAIVWIAGLWHLLADRKGRRYRSLGWAFLFFLLLMMLLKGKDYYLAPAYPMLFAAGGVFWERLIAAQNRRWRASIPVAIMSVISLAGAIAAPVFAPILPVADLIRYQDAIGLHPPKAEVGHVGLLPQYFGDMFGWPEMVASVAKVYDSLSAQDRSRAAILAGNYGEAGAIDFFGPAYGLPKSVCAHQNYYYWGPRGATGDVVILLQWSRQSAERWFERVQEGPELDCPYSMAEERYRILIGWHSKQSLEQLWPRLKHWN